MRIEFPINPVRLLVRLCASDARFSLLEAYPHGLRRGGPESKVTVKRRG